MAKPLAFVPPPAPVPTDAETARAELDDLAALLHEHGVLRALNGLLAAAPEVSEIAMEQVDSPAGRRIVRNAVILGTLATGIDPDKLATLTGALARGIEAASAQLAQEPPSTVNVLKSLNDPDLRRGLSAVLALLKAFGQGPQS